MMSGAFYKCEKAISNYPYQESGTGWKTYFAASAYNPIYGSSDVVQPASISLISQIKF